MNIMNNESNSNFQAVTFIGGGYLTLSFQLGTLLLKQTDPATDSLIAMFGILTQVGFFIVFFAQYVDRRKHLGLTDKLAKFAAKGDVVLIMLHCLGYFLALWLVMFAFVVFITSHMHGPLPHKLNF